jgi:hypothetical protein
MFVNNQELMYYSLLHQLFFFLPHLDVKLQRLSLYRYIHKDSLNLALVLKLFILFITEIMQIILSLIQCE